MGDAIELFLGDLSNVLRDEFPDWPILLFLTQDRPLYGLNG
jgi:hypothetical protein